MVIINLEITVKSSLILLCIKQVGRSPSQTEKTKLMCLCINEITYTQQVLLIARTMIIILCTTKLS